MLTFFITTYHKFLPCIVNIFTLQIGASFFYTTYHEYVPSYNSLLHTHAFRFTLPTVPSYPHIPLTTYPLHSSSWKYPCRRCIFRSPPSCSTCTALAPCFVHQIMFLIVFSVRIGFIVFKNATNNHISLVRVNVVQSSISICNFV